MRVRDATPEDAPAIAAIYNHYIAGTIVTFEEETIDASEIRTRLAQVRAASLPWLVADDGNVAGYAYASPWKTRRAYRFAVEATVYLDPARTGQGVGSLLYAELFERLHAAGMHVVIGGIALPNDASVRLHEKMGMTKVAHFEQVGFKLGRWIDVGYWQRTL